MRFKCAWNSKFEDLLKQGFPSLLRRTLRRKIEPIEFQPGISHELLQYLEDKVANFDDCIRECLLALDYLSILGRKIYDSQTKEIIGNFTLPENTESTVKHGSIYVIFGTHSR